MGPPSVTLHHTTPLLHSSALSALASRPVYLKLENVQPGGSFKIRGIGNLCRQAQLRGCTCIVSSSGGNAGVAAALAGRLLGMKVVVCVPTTTPELMRRLIRDEGAEVVVHGDVWDEADQEARRILASLPEGSAAYVSPFNHPDIWDGHATMIDEVKQQLQGVKPAAVVVSVGGGGLFLGTERGLARNGWDDVPIVACETRGAESFARMLEARELVALPQITSIAKSLGALKVAEECLNVVKRGKPVQSYVMDDRAAVDAVLGFADRHRMLVESSCGAALAFAYSPTALADLVPGDGAIVVVVCGGNLVNLDQIAQWRVNY